MGEMPLNVEKGRSPVIIKVKMEDLATGAAKWQKLIVRFKQQNRLSENSESRFL